MKRQNTYQDAIDQRQRENRLDHSMGAMLKLQHKREQLEMRLQEKCLELKKLCLQEFELTGALPMETPLEVNESPPKMKRKIPTMFPYDQELLKQLEEGSTSDSPKRKALSPWNSCDNLPLKSTSPYASPKSPRHNTWTSPQGHPSSRTQTRSRLPKTFKFFKKRFQ